MPADPHLQEELLIDSVLMLAGHFQSGGALLSSHLKDNHIETVFVVFHVNGSLSKGNGQLSARASHSTLCCEEAAALGAPPPLPPLHQ